MGHMAGQAIRCDGPKRSQLAPRLFFNTKGQIYAEVHMDDVRLAAPSKTGLDFVEELSKRVRVKALGPFNVGGVYSYLK